MSEQQPEPERPDRTPPPCPTCQGRGGTTLDSSSGDVLRLSWQSCPDCTSTSTESSR
ncbi:hypothetical protein [Streptomyces sp. NPDC088789]|uniref:hypothetical protein n=1 Tax=Streptomyces sp. NPDC088789 TaxID=3365899 RepID=UPI00382C53EF